MVEIDNRKQKIQLLLHMVTYFFSGLTSNILTCAGIDPSPNVTTLSEQDHSQHPVGRVGRPEDIADMVLYLCSDKASFITGQNVIIDGGMTKKMIYIE